MTRWEEKMKRFNEGATREYGGRIFYQTDDFPKKTEIDKFKKRWKDNGFYVRVANTAGGPNLWVAKKTGSQKFEEKELSKHRGHRSMESRMSSNTRENIKKKK